MGSRPICVVLSHVAMNILVPTHTVTAYLPVASLVPKVHLCSAVANTTLFKKKMTALISILTSVSVNPYKANYQPSGF